MLQPLAPWLLLCALLLGPASACYLQGQDSGHCVSTSALSEALPFCSQYIRLYPSACLPNEYPMYPNHTATRKDQWVQQQAMDVIAHRIEVEKTNGAGFTLLPWEGTVGSILVHFLKNDACQEAYKRYFCYLNFPRCDEAQNSLLLCRSACENFFKACGYPKSPGNMTLGMWRCGPAMYSGGYSAEVAEKFDTQGQPVYERGSFPGLPFADNAPGACTPGVEGGAGSAGLSALALALAAALALALAS